MAGKLFSWFVGCLVDLCVVRFTGIGNVTGIVCYDIDLITRSKSTFAKKNVSVCAKCVFRHRNQNKSEFDDDIYNFCSYQECGTPECFVVNTNVKITELKGNVRFTYADVHNEGDLLVTKNLIGRTLKNPDEKNQQTSDFIVK